MTEWGLYPPVHLFAYMQSYLYTFISKELKTRCFLCIFPLANTVHCVSLVYIIHCENISVFINNVSLRHANKKKNCELPTLFYTTLWYALSLPIYAALNTTLHANDDFSAYAPLYPSYPLSIAVHHGMQNNLSGSLANLFCI